MKFSIIFKDYNDIIGNTINRNQIINKVNVKGKLFHRIRKQFNKIDKDSVRCSSTFIFQQNMFCVPYNGFNVPDIIRKHHFLPNELKG